MNTNMLNRLFSFMFSLLALSSINIYAEKQEEKKEEKQEEKQEEKKEEKSELKGKLTLDAAGGKGNLELTGKYIYKIAKNKYEALQALTLEGGIGNILSNETRKGILEKESSKDRAEELAEKMLKQVSAKLTLIPAKNTELSFKIGLQKAAFFDKKSYGINLNFKQLTSDLELQLGFYAEPGKYSPKFWESSTSSMFLSIDQGQVLGTPYSIGFQTGFLLSYDETDNASVYHLGGVKQLELDANGFFGGLIKKIPGISLEFKKGEDEEDRIIDSFKIVYKAAKNVGTNAKVEGSPGVTLSMNLSGPKLSEELDLPSWSEYLPENMPKAFGSLKSLSFSAIFHLEKTDQLAKHDDDNPNEKFRFENHLDEIGNNITFKLEAKFKDLCDYKGTELSLGFKFKPKTNDHDSEPRFAFIASYTKNFTLI